MVGNISNFTKPDILRCFLRFNKNSGRQELARDLELGEGTIRTILKKLKSRKLLDSSKKGHFLSKKGMDILHQVNNSISMPKPVVLEDFYQEYEKMGVLVRNVQDLKGLHRLRDVAVKNGAEGAVILRYDTRLYAPESNLELDFREVEKHFDLKKNDVLIVAFSNEKRKAENSALAIAIELNDFLKKFINEF